MGRERTFFPLYAVLDVDVAARRRLEPVDLARAFLAGGARWIQVRAKQMPGGSMLALCEAVVSEARAEGAIVIVNDRADVARLSGAAGVHVGQDDLSVEGARHVLGEEAIVGVSTHDVRQVETALRTSADYIAVGPVFETRTKDTGYAAVGLELVREAAARTNGRPVVAIGGITLENAPAVIEAGATAVAVISDLLEGEPERRAAAYVARLETLRR
jgi:thiamine-phosphate pyrophosphorylase